MTVYVPAAGGRANPVAAKEASRLYVPAAGGRVNPVAAKEPSSLRSALDRVVHRLTGLHLIEPCNCARCQLRRFNLE
jgi:hypothetical protein